MDDTSAGHSLTLRFPRSRRLNPVTGRRVGESVGCFSDVLGEPQAVWDKRRTVLSFRKGARVSKDKLTALIQEV